MLRNAIIAAGSPRSAPRRARRHSRTTWPSDDLAESSRPSVKLITSSSFASERWAIHFAERSVDPHESWRNCQDAHRV